MKSGFSKKFPYRKFAATLYRVTAEAFCTLTMTPAPCTAALHSTKAQIYNPFAIPHLREFTCSYLR